MATDQPNSASVAGIPQAVCAEICQRFLHEGTSTPRIYLAKKFRDTQILAELDQCGYIENVGDRTDSTATYIPHLGAFVLANDGESLNTVRRGAVAALKELLDLFLNTDANPHFTPEQIFEGALRKDSDLDARSLEVGLLIASRLGAFSGTTDEARVRIVQVFLNDGIVNIHDATAWIDDHIKRLRALSAGRMSGSSQLSKSPLLVLDYIPETEIQLNGSDVEFDWSLLHPAVQEVSRSRYASHHYADAVESSLKAINQRLRHLYRAERGADKDGANLMYEVFSSRTPVLSLGDLSTLSGQDMQKGYMQIFAGAMTGIRNPKAHDNVNIDRIRAIHFLFFASLLMYKIDEAKLVKPSDDKHVA